MKLITPIHKLMTDKVHTVQPNQSMDEVRKIFEKHNFHHLPVVDRGKIVGLLSTTDYLRVIREIFDNSQEAAQNQKVLKSVLAKDLMSTDMETLHVNDTVADAIRIFKTNEHHALPVVDEDMHLKGIVTMYDLLLRLERKLMEEEAEAL